MLQVSLRNAYQGIVHCGRGRGVAQPGSALASGARGRWFKSTRPDQIRRPMRATRLLIRGIVQGVGYRFFARRTARAMGVRGTVRTLPDGRVEAVAAGTPDSLAVFIGELRRGPSGSRVDDIEVTDTEMDDRVSGYSILA